MALVKRLQNKEPNIIKLTSGSGTYIPSVGVKRLQVTVVGGGGGGAGAGGSAPGTTGNSSTFGSSLLTAGGGAGGIYYGAGGVGGGCIINSPAIEIYKGTGNSGGSGGGGGGSGRLFVEEIKPNLEQLKDL